MKNIRLILPLLVAAFLLSPLWASQVFAQPTVGYFAVPYDTVNGTAEKVPLLGFTITTPGNGGSEDTLFKLAVESWMEKEFSVKKLYLYRQDDADTSFSLGDDLLTQLDLTRFDSDEDVLLIEAPYLALIGSGVTDTFYLVVDVFTDSVDYDPDYYLKGMEAMINADSIWMGDGYVIPDSVINSGFGVHPVSGLYRVYLDTDGPDFTLNWAHYYDSTCIYDTVTGGTISIGDSIRIWSPDADSSDIAADSDIVLDLAFMGYPNLHLRRPNYDTTIVVQDGGADCVDIKPGFPYTIYGYAWDNTGIWGSIGNKDSTTLTFDKPIDTCKPIIDYLQFFLSYSHNGDSIAAIGDSLTIYAFCTSNDSFEVMGVIANIKNYRQSGDPDTLLTLIDEITNNNRIFRKTFILDQAVPIDIVADSTRGRIWVTAWDNACNSASADTTLGSPVDLQPPPVDSSEYLVLVDLDSSFCINIGDSVVMRVSTDAALDVDSVVANVLSAGIGLTSIEPLYDDGTHGDAAATDNWWTLNWEVLEPPPDSAKDPDAGPFDSDYSVWFRAYDDAGNTTSVQKTFEAGYTIDTYRPHALLKDSIHVELLPAGRVRLKWQTLEPLVQEEDAFRFFVYVDSTQSGVFDFDHPFGATEDGEYTLEAGWNAWTSEVLTHGKTYWFVIRTQDNCYNLEFNEDIIEAIPDGQAPLICIIEPDTGLSFGSCDNCLVVKALTSDVDADHAQIMWRFKDVGGIPGPWNWWGSDMNTLAGDTTYPGHKVFIDTLCDFPGTDTYELIVIGWDLVGNQTSINFALTCSPVFYFHWYDYVLDADFVSINGAYSPQSACGYDVWRDSLNQVVVTILDTTYNDYVYTVDIWAILTAGDSTRVDYREHQRMPYTFDSLNVGDWPKGTQQLFVKITDERTGCLDEDQIALCVPDTLAPQASIVYPRYGQRVRLVTSSLNIVEILAQVNFNALDSVVVSNVHFEYSLDLTDWFLIEKVLGTNYRTNRGVKIWVGHWDNSNLADGDTVYLRALFYDELHNEYITPLVMVVIDAHAPDIVLSIPQIMEINGVKKVRGYIDLIAELQNSSYIVNDIDEVRFYIKRADKPDIFWYYSDIGVGTKLTNTSIWKLENVNTGSWDDQYWWDIRAIAKDIAGNVMWDYDGDQLFDAYTFNEFNPSDKMVFVDNMAPQPVIFSVMSIGLDDTIETVNPSVWLGGSAKAFAQAGKIIQVKTNALRWPPYDMMVDTAEVEKIEYDIDGDTIGYRTSYPYTVTFDPADFGYTAIDGYDSFKLTASCYDWLGNTVKTDTVRIYILDVTGNEVVITSPTNNSYRSRDITLQGAALDGYSSDIKSVTYQYSVDGITWYDIGTKTGSQPWTYSWHTFNNIADGWYFLMAKSEDKSGNFAYGPVIKVNITNHDPIAYMIAPPDSSIVGPNLNIRPNGVDVAVQSVAKKYSAQSAGIDYVRFRQKVNTSSSWSTFGLNPDSLTQYMDSIYTRLWRIPSGYSSGWRHVACEAYDSAGNYSWSDTLNLFIDRDDPQGEIVTINGDHNNYMKDITYPDTTLIVARIWDMPQDYNAGLDTIQFYIYGPAGFSYFGTPLGPDATGQYWLTWNHAGLPPGTYYIGIYMVDGVNNNAWADKEVPVVIRDVTVPVGVVRAFHPNRIFATTENAVTYLQIQYKPAGGDLGGSDWINLGLANTSDVDTNLWVTAWDPMSLAGVDDLDYYFRAVPMRGWVDKQGLQKFAVLDDFIAPEALITVTPDGEVTTEGTEDIGPMSFTANLAYDSKGTISLTQTSEKPYLLAVYTDLNDSVQYFTPLTLDKVIGEDTYNSFFDAKWISAIAGRADFFASIYGSPIYIEDGGFIIHKVFKAFGTNGWVSSHDGTAKIKMPEGVIADSLANLLIIPAQKPDVTSIPHIDYLPVGNENGMLQQFYLYWASNNGNGGPGSGGIVYPEYNVYSTIVLSYNEDEVQIDESELQVGRWNKTNLRWEFTGIRDLVIDTENNTVEFKTNQMGLYAVVQKTSGGSIFATIEVEPNCSDYTYEYPLFKAKIIDEYSGVNVGSIEIRYGPAGGYLDIAYKDNDHAAGFDFPDGYDNYDPISGILKIEKIDQPIPAGTYVVTVSARNNFGILATAETTFTVDCTPPEVNVPHGYVPKNPDFTFTVKDAESGVDKDYVYVALYSATMSDSQYTWSRKYIETVSPSDVEWVNDTTVRIFKTYHLRNAQYLDIVIYSGDWDYYYYYYDDGYAAHGIPDCVGNHATVVERRFAVDWVAPTITLLNELSDRPIKFRIVDHESGVKTVVADPEDPSFDLDTLDSSTRIFLYTPPDGATKFTIIATDTVGNATDSSFDVKVPPLTIKDTYNWPNPFDPRNEVTTIEIGNISAKITVKIYDFAGDYVTTLTPVNGEYRWKGTTEDGDIVANGVYLCYIKAKDGSNTVTEVVKIAVVKKD